MDFWRGKITPRRLGVLIHYLPRDSALVTAINDGEPPLSRVEHFLADLWALLVRANSEKGSLPDDFDHPTRAAMAAKMKTAAKQSLKALYLKRKRDRAARYPTQSGGSGQ